MDDLERDGGDSRKFVGVDGRGNGLGGPLAVELYVSPDNVSGEFEVYVGWAELYEKLDST
jgi:hypothetical protein